jgi:hypothetical protein
MFGSSNLANFLRGGTHSRELAETRATWEQTQALWRASPFARKHASDFALELVKEAAANADRAPAVPILVALAEAIETLLRSESIGDIEPHWDLIESHVEVGVEFRQVLARRMRWSGEFSRLYGAFRRIVLEAADAFFKSLPESCFGDWDRGRDDTFDVVLLDLLDDPAKTVEQLFALPYDDDSFRFDLFKQLRELCVHNLLIASGFQPTADVHEVKHRFIYPTGEKNKSKTGAELANLYLSGNPLKALLDVPVPFHIPHELRFEHCHIVGGTGHGKTQLIQKMIHADLVASQIDDRSVIVIDSQGDLINKLMRLELFSPDVRHSLAERLVVIDPADVEFPAALNLFDAHLDRVKEYSAADRERVLNGVIELYELFFGAFLGAELTQKQGVIFKYLARLMLAIPDATIYTLMRIMEDGKPFKPYMDKLDGSARYFFETEFFHPSFAATKKQVLRRLWGVLSTPAFERMFTQPKNKLDLFEAMNEGKIILVNTAKDLLKREGSQLLGRFFIAMITQAALERSTVPEHRRNSAFVYVDEAQEYFDDSIETILNQARKYHVGLTLAHQTLDQLSPRLRSAILANTSMKCAGGVSAKDARVLADELHTTSDFIESMKRRGPRSEFAVWVKNLTGKALRLTVPLGFLEREPVLADEDYDALVENNRERFCGTLADIQVYTPPITPAETGRTQAETPQKTEPSPPQTTPEPIATPPKTEAQPVEVQEPEPTPPVQVSASPATERAISEPSPPTLNATPERHRPDEQEFGKGGPKHRYLQSLIKELAEQQGLKATIEAPLATGNGQVDVLIERDGVLAAIEISVTTPVEHEKENLRKCLACDYPRIAVVLAKSKTVQTSYRTALREVVGDGDRERVSFLMPEELPGFIQSLAPLPEPTERIVKGYRVKGSFTKTTPEAARARQDAVARLIARSLAEQKK